MAPFATIPELLPEAALTTKRFFTPPIPPPSFSPAELGLAIPPKNTACHLSILMSMIMWAYIYRRFMVLPKYSELNTIVSWAALCILNGLDIRVDRANLTPLDILAAEDFITKAAPLSPGGYCHTIFALSIFLFTFYTKIITT
jgi:hypothetical protein